MKRNYVILQESKAPFFERAPEAAPAETHVEMQTLSTREASEMMTRRQAAAIAPVMPMRLIEPVSLGGEAQIPAGRVAWGLEAVGATTSAFDGDGIVVAVLDTGIDPNHEAFQGVTLESRNFTQAGPDDDHGHGTHCAGTVFGLSLIHI